MSGTRQPHGNSYCVTVPTVIVVGTIGFTVSTCVHVYYTVKNKIKYTQNKRRKAIGAGA
jgi:hypothetical protein